MVFCQSGGNVVKTSKVCSTERSALINADHGTALLDAAGSLVLTPNGSNQAEIAVKDLVPYSGSLVDMHENGIGIVKFLRGKGFLITGATGFLAKGAIFPFSKRYTIIYILLISP